MAHKKSEWDLFTIATGKKTIKSVKNANRPGLDRTKLDLLTLEREFKKLNKEVWDDG